MPPSPETPQMSEAHWVLAPQGEPGDAKPPPVLAVPTPPLVPPPPVVPVPPVVLPVAAISSCVPWQLVARRNTNPITVAEKLRIAPPRKERMNSIAGEAHRTRGRPRRNPSSQSRSPLEWLPFIRRRTEWLSTTTACPTSRTSSEEPRPVPRETAGRAPAHRSRGHWCFQRSSPWAPASRVRADEAAGGRPRSGRTSRRQEQRPPKEGSHQGDHRSPGKHRRGLHRQRHRQGPQAPEDEEQALDGQHHAGSPREGRPREEGRGARVPGGVRRAGSSAPPSSLSDLASQR